MMNSETTWLTALNWVFAAEGGDSDDANDPGGATRYGISLRYLKSKGLLGDIDGDGDIDAQDIWALDKNRAASFYRTDFWDKCKCDQLPFPLAIIVFDQAVNTGTGTTAKMLQRHVGVTVDGIIGPDTIAHIVAKFRSNPTWFIASYMGKRARYYHDITLRNSNLAKFLNGWFNRLFQLQQFVTENT